MDRAVGVAVRHRRRQLAEPEERARERQPAVARAAVAGRRRARRRLAAEVVVAPLEHQHVEQLAAVAELAALEDAAALHRPVDHAVDVRVRRRRRAAHELGGEHLHRHRAAVVVGAEEDGAAAPVGEEVALRARRVRRVRLRRLRRPPHLAVGLGARRRARVLLGRARLGERAVGHVGLGALPRRREGAPLLHRVVDELGDVRRRHRLEAVRVGAHLEQRALHQPLLLGAAQQHDRRPVAHRAAERGQHGVGVAARQQVVEEHQIERRLRAARERLAAAARRERLGAARDDHRLHGERRLRRDLVHDLAERALLERVVLNDEDTHKLRQLHREAARYVQSSARLRAILGRSRSRGASRCVASGHAITAVCAHA